MFLVPLPLSFFSLSYFYAIQVGKFGLEHVLIPKMERNTGTDDSNLETDSNEFEVIYRSGSTKRKADLVPRRSTSLLL